MRTRTAALALTAALPLALLGPTAAATAAATPPPPREGLPQFSHVVVLVEENEDAAATFAEGSPATYLNGLRERGVFLPNYFGTSHASLGNYITLVSGQASNPVLDSDCAGLSLYACAQSVAAGSTSTPGRHLGDQLDDVGLSWASYSDGGTPEAPLPACFHAPYSAQDTAPDPYHGNSRTPPAYDYADRHVPFLYFDDVVADQPRCESHVRTFATFAGDLATDVLPAFSLVVPDTCHDGHDDPCSDGRPGGLVAADAWLAQQVPPLLDYLAAHDGLLVVVFDEGRGESAGPCAECVGGGAGGRTGAVLVSPRLPQGTTVTTGYDHASLLRTLESSFGLDEHLNLAADAAPMTAAFAGTRPPPSPTPPASAPTPTVERPTTGGTARDGGLAALGGIVLGLAAFGVLRRRRSGSGSLPHASAEGAQDATG